MKITATLTQDMLRKPCDVVLWNPWKEKAQQMSDFGDEEYKNMICIEPGCVSRYETCEPGQSWTLTQVIEY